MLRNHVTKLLLFLPTLFLLSVILFFLKTQMPQDPVEQSMGIYASLDGDHQAYTNSQYIQEAKKLGIDKPNFYFSIRPNDYPEQLIKIVLPAEKKIAKLLIKKGCQWSDIEKIIKFRADDNFIKINQWIENFIQDNKQEIRQEDFTSAEAEAMLQLKQNIKTRRFYPSFRWNGSENQYHHWVSQFFTKSTLTSHIDNQEVFPKIWNSLIWTMTLSLLSIFIIYFLGVFLGIKLVSSDKPIWKYTQSFLDLFFTMPLFWLATLLVIFFTTKEYGTWTNIFASVHGMDLSDVKGFMGVVRNIHHLILPLLCITLHSLGFMSHFMEQNLRAQMSKRHILTARQKGLSKNAIIRNHGIKNALFPVVTLLSNALPGSISGSLVIEVIFNLPGMGRLTYNSVVLADWNVLFPIVMMVGTLTLFSFWLVDILYTRLDPRVKESLG